LLLHECGDSLESAPDYEHGQNYYFSIMSDVIPDHNIFLTNVINKRTPEPVRDQITAIEKEFSRIFTGFYIVRIRHACRYI
jgi:hypothetical protein